ncbi:membrane-anchored junction protein isoform X2 [Danio rerio]|uniref:Membrane-anchored junction protein isoform X2 n=3 Tax=Danio rerio TaxID=7955 RepID=A0AC58G495_DANRE|nr:membrane-anchored junction protein [Danio rerio]|eukprot:XP_021333820.1 membrane-anchored junction protein [Danio rerio]
MAIQAFTFPLPETRFFLAEQRVFKFKIRRGDMSSIDEEDMLDGALVSEELENAVRAVLANLDDLHPFTTQNFNIFPYKRKWEQVSKMRFTKEGQDLIPYPFLITLYVEYREPAFQHTVTNTSDWNTAETFPTMKRAQCACEPLKMHQTTVMDPPEEGNMSQHKQNKLSSEDLQCCQESPFSAIGAEAMVCGTKIHADSDATCLQEPEVCDAAPKSHDSNSGQNSGIIARMASSLFPFSVFFNKSSAR